MNALRGYLKIGIVSIALPMVENPLPRHVRWIRSAMFHGTSRMNQNCVHNIEH